MRTQDHRGLAALALVVAALAPTIAFAHPGHDIATGFMAGVEHPWTGADHVAVMLAAGLWAARLGKHSIPAFLGATVVGIVGGTGLGVVLDMLTSANDITAFSPFSQMAFTGGFLCSMLALQLLGAVIALSFSPREDFLRTAGA